MSDYALITLSNSLQLALTLLYVKVISSFVTRRTKSVQFPSMSSRLLDMGSNWVTQIFDSILRYIDYIVIILRSTFLNIDQTYIYTDCSVSSEAENWGWDQCFFKYGSNLNKTYMNNALGRDVITPEVQFASVELGVVWQLYNACASLFQHTKTHWSRSRIPFRYSLWNNREKPLLQSLVARNNPDIARNVAWICEVDIKTRTNKIIYHILCVDGYRIQIFDNGINGC